MDSNVFEHLFLAWIADKKRWPPFAQEIDHVTAVNCRYPDGFTGFLIVVPEENLQKALDLAREVFPEPDIKISARCISARMAAIHNWNEHVFIVINAPILFAVNLRKVREVSMDPFLKLCDLAVFRIWASVWHHIASDLYRDFNTPLQKLAETAPQTADISMFGKVGGVVRMKPDHIIEKFTVSDIATAPADLITSEMFSLLCPYGFWSYAIDRNIIIKTRRIGVARLRVLCKHALLENESVYRRELARMDAPTAKYVQRLMAMREDY